MMTKPNLVFVFGTISFRLDGSAVLDRDGRPGSPHFGSVGFHFFDHVQAAGDLSEDDVLSVQPGGLRRADEDCPIDRLFVCCFVCLLFRLSFFRGRVCGCNKSNNMVGAWW